MVCVSSLKENGLKLHAALIPQSFRKGDEQALDCLVRRRAPHRIEGVGFDLIQISLIIHILHRSICTSCERHRSGQFNFRTCLKTDILVFGKFCHGHYTSLNIHTGCVQIGTDVINLVCIRCKIFIFLNNDFQSVAARAAVFCGCKFVCCLFSSTVDPVKIHRLRMQKNLSQSSLFHVRIALQMLSTLKQN